jgi:membrane protease YdiL (CAAX protease family)
MKQAGIWTVGVAVFILLAVYIPAFAATSLIRPTLPVAIALIIGVSLFVALAIISWLSQRGRSFAAFGLALSSIRWIVLAFAVGLPLALGAAWLASAFPSPAPFDVASLPRWQQALFFLVAAPVQEEVIFRGLVQSVLQERWSGTFAIRGARLSIAVICTAVLFAIVHFGSGLATVAGALMLSILAGEMRRRSGSLVPAMVVHSLFNVAAMLVPSA